MMTRTGARQIAGGEVEPIERAAHHERYPWPGMMVHDRVAQPIAHGAGAPLRIAPVMSASP